MKTIITGGSGSIGRALARHLIEHGHSVVILSRDPARVTGLPAGARAVEWDAQTAAGWAHEADGADAIVNLAGENLAGPGFFPARWTAARKERLYQSRIHAGQAVAEAVEIAAHKPAVVIQASAVGYYGPRGDEIVTEETPPGDDFLARLCVDWEAASARVEQMGVRRAVIRTGIFLTPREGALWRMMLPFKFFAGGPFGNGRQYYAWIHPRDHVEAVRFLIENPQARGPFNLTAPNPVENKTFARTLGQVMRRPAFMPVPGFALRGMFGEVATVVLDGQRVIPKKLQEMGFRFEFPALESALRDCVG